MKKDFRVYVNQILEAICEIEEFTKGSTYEDFLKNKMAIKAVVNEPDSHRGKT
jgi:uncharacterized protein with HEPN domain